MRDELRERRIQRLVSLARQLANRRGLGGNPFEALRRPVAEEALRDATTPITCAALAALQGERAQGLLLDVLRYSTQCFHLEDRILACLVIPVSVRLRALRHGSARVTAGHPFIIGQMERLLARRIGAKAIHLDNRLYTARDLVSASPTALRAHLLGLEAGLVDLPRLGPGSCLVANTDPDWVGLYFVGVIVYGQGKFPDLETEAVQMKADTLRWQPGVALEFTHPEHWRQGIECETECLGFYFKHQGICAGEENVQAARLRCFLTCLAGATSAPKFCFAEDRD